MKELNTIQCIIHNIQQYIIIIFSYFFFIHNEKQMRESRNNWR